MEITSKDLMAFVIRELLVIALAAAVGLAAYTFALAISNIRVSVKTQDAHIKYDNLSAGARKAADEFKGMGLTLISSIGPVRDKTIDAYKPDNTKFMKVNFHQLSDADFMNLILYLYYKDQGSFTTREDIKKLAFNTCLAFYFIVQAIRLSRWSLLSSRQKRIAQILESQEGTEAKG